MPLFTAERAAQAGKLSGQRRRERAEAKKLAKLNGEPAPSPTQVNAIVNDSKRLARVRRQLNMLDSRLETELSKDGSELLADGTPVCCDGQLVNWLCTAQERLAEQERILAGRPLPGSLRPSSKPSRSSTPTQADFTDPTPST